MPLPVGSTALLLVRVDVSNADGTGSVTVLDSDHAPVGTSRAMPVKVMAALQPVSVVLSIGDVMQSVDTGLTAVVRWVSDQDPAVATQWSPATNRQPTYPAEGWVKVGTASLD